MPMTVIAHHLIWTNYGMWLPNDPRGSGSRSVYTPALAELGEAHYGRRVTQPQRRVIHQFYDAAAARLQFPVIRFDDPQRETIAAAFALAVRAHRYTCYACAILPDHVHLVIRKHKYGGEMMIDHFQEESRLLFRSLSAAFAEHPIWTKGGWNTFLDSPAAVRQRIGYVENNPGKEGLPRQAWPFVVAYDNWPFHKGRS